MLFCRPRLLLCGPYCTVTIILYDIKYCYSLTHTLTLKNNALILVVNLPNAKSTAPNPRTLTYVSAKSNALILVLCLPNPKSTAPNPRSVVPNLKCCL